MPTFEYGKLPGEDNEPGVKKEKKDLIRLPDGSEYDGEWVDRKRHGRGQ